jgi:hypothetical protein
MSLSILPDSYLRLWHSRHFGRGTTLFIDPTEWRSTASSSPFRPKCGQFYEAAACPSKPSGRRRQNHLRRVNLRRKGPGSSQVPPRPRRSILAAVVAVLRQGRAILKRLPPFRGSLLQRLN